jgi:Fe-S cluster biogenesis protein NfuA
MSDNSIEKYTLEEQLKGLIETLDAYIAQYHGGSVELVEFKNNKVKVHMGGACEECPASLDMGIHWVSGTIKQFFPEIESIERI